jgi:hypothetical protein
MPPGRVFVVVTAVDIGGASGEVTDRAKRAAA